MKKTLKFEVELDENHLPVNIEMNATDGNENEGNIKALMISAWAAETKETLRIDLWTKDMPVNEMFIMYHQTMMGMASTLERATGQEKLANALRDYCAFFAEQTKIIKSNRGFIERRHCLENGLNNSDENQEYPALLELPFAQNSP